MSCGDCSLRYLIVAAIVALYLLWCYLSWWRHWRRPVLITQGQWIIATASQTGSAEQLAEQTQQQLQQSGITSVVLPLNQLAITQLQQGVPVLFIVSTYGEGEPPDNGARFLHQLGKADLSALNYAVLALGDSQYTKFCAFGQALEHGLRERGASALFDRIDVDQLDAGSLRHWQSCLGQITGYTGFSDWQKADYQPWKLNERRWLNPGSPGAPVYRLELVPEQGAVLPDAWQAGDIAEIGPCNDAARIRAFLQQLSLPADAQSLQALLRKQLPQQAEQVQALQGMDIAALSAQLDDLPHREYSIASIPSSGSLTLLVRQLKHGDNDWGLGSGWLTHFAEVGESVLLKIRSNRRFHAPDAARPMILIGNGTGIAGLRSHLQQRIQQGALANWLLFGERSAAHDDFFANDLRQWQQHGQLQQLDQVFSRDRTSADAPRYVQDLLAMQAETLCQWVEQGAVIYVCGSLHGMAQGVDAQLTAILGEAQILKLADEDRYCRDVY